MAALRAAAPYFHPSIAFDLIAFTAFYRCLVIIEGHPEEFSGFSIIIAVVILFY